MTERPRETENNEKERENVAKISILLGKSIRATILDGRKFTGIFKVSYL